MTGSAILIQYATPVWQTDKRTDGWTDADLLSPEMKMRETQPTKCKCAAESGCLGGGGCWCHQLGGLGSTVSSPSGIRGGTSSKCWCWFIFYLKFSPQPPNWNSYVITNIAIYVWGNARDFHHAAGGSERHKKCVSFTRDVWDLAGLQTVTSRRQYTALCVGHLRRAVKCKVKLLLAHWSSFSRMPQDVWTISLQKTSHNFSQREAKSENIAAFPAFEWQFSFQKTVLSGLGLFYGCDYRPTVTSGVAQWLYILSSTHEARQFFDRPFSTVEPWEDDDDAKHDIVYSMRSRNLPQRRCCCFGLLLYHSYDL